MAYQDRIIFAANDNMLALTLQDAGLCTLAENRVIPAAGVVLYSYIGDAYGDGMAYCFITMDDAIINVPAIDARLVANLDPARTPLRVRAGVVISDPDAAARVAFASDTITKRELQFRNYKGKVGTPHVSRSALRYAAQAISNARLAELDASIASLTKGFWNVRWDENDDFSRTDLAVLETAVVPMGKTHIDNVFDGAIAAQVIS